MEILTIAPSAGISYYLVIFVIFAVGQIRVLLYKSKRPWTNKIGGKWVWISAAAVISILLCVVFKINLIQDLTNLSAIGSIKLDGYLGYVASGLAISFSSNISAWAAERPNKVAIKDLEEGNSIPGTVNTTEVVESHWSTPVEPVIPVEPMIPIEPIDITPQPVYYKTILLTPWISENPPEYLMIERDDGVKRVLNLSNDELKSVEEAWSKISNLEV